MVTNNTDYTLERYVEELANDPEYIAEGLAMDVTDQMLELLAERGLTQSWLAQQMGVSRARVSRILHASPNMTLLTIARIAVALGVKPGVRLNAERPHKRKARNGGDGQIRREPNTEGASPPANRTGERV